jgi:hypothetical protein
MGTTHSWNHPQLSITNSIRLRSFHCQTKGPPHHNMGKRKLKLSMNKYIACHAVALCCTCVGTLILIKETNIIYNYLMSDLCI